MNSIYLTKTNNFAFEKTKSELLFVLSNKKKLISKTSLHLGDCLKLMTNIQDNSIDMICCDLPYGTTNCKWDTQIDLPNLWKQYKRITKPNAAIILFAQTPFDKILGCSNLEWLRYEIIWEKTNATGHLNANKMPLKAHENILVFYKKLPVYNPQKTNGHPRKTSNVKNKSQSNFYQKVQTVTLYDSTQRFPRSVQIFKSDKQKLKLHSTQKPLALLEWLIKTYSNAGDVVLDNCMGSGTTSVACKKLGRNFIGMENDEDIFHTAHKRIQ